MSDFDQYKTVETPTKLNNASKPLSFLNKAANLGSFDPQRHHHNTGTSKQQHLTLENTNDS